MPPGLKGHLRLLHPPSSSLGCCMARPLLTLLRWEGATSGYAGLSDILLRMDPPPDGGAVRPRGPQVASVGPPRGAAWGQAGPVRLKQTLSPAGPGMRCTPGAGGLPPPARHPFPFLLPLPPDTLWTEEDQLPGWPRAELRGGHDKTGPHRIVEGAQSLKPGGAGSNPTSATSLLCGLGQIISASGASVSSVNGGSHLPLPSKDVAKIRRSVCDDPGKCLIQSKCSRNTGSLISSFRPASCH